MNSTSCTIVHTLQCDPKRRPPTGFLLFRHSIKVVVGVCWTIGKKSSSLSNGDRGAHYTVGKSIRRTVVGMDLPYTNVPPPTKKWPPSLGSIDYEKRGSGEAVK
jgi:hypothetical protein